MLTFWSIWHIFTNRRLQIESNPNPIHSNANRNQQSFASFVLFVRPYSLFITLVRISLENVRFFGEWYLSVCASLSSIWKFYSCCSFFVLLLSVCWSFVFFVIWVSILTNFLVEEYKDFKGDKAHRDLFRFIFLTVFYFCDTISVKNFIKNQKILNLCYQLF